MYRWPTLAAMLGSRECVGRVVLCEDPECCDVRAKASAGSVAVEVRGALRGKLTKSIALSRFCVVDTRCGLEMVRFSFFFDLRRDSDRVQLRPVVDSFRASVLGLRASVSCCVRKTASSEKDGLVARPSVAPDASAYEAERFSMAPGNALGASTVCPVVKERCGAYFRGRELGILRCIVLGVYCNDPGAAADNGVVDVVPAASGSVPVL